MGRIRTIKPEFWRHEVLSSLSPETHMLAAALINYADDEGYFNAHPGLVKAECMPLRDPSVSVHDMLTELSKIGFIQTAKGTDGKTYGRVVKFSEHQRVNRPTKSKIKELVSFTESSLNAQCIVSETSLLEVGTGNREVGTGNREHDSAGAHADKSASVTVTAKDLVSEYGISKQHAAEWMEVRKAKRAKLTRTAMDAMIREAGKAGLTLNDAVRMCVERSWAGFKAEYMANNSRGGGASGGETPQQRAERMAKERGIL